MLRSFTVRRETFPIRGEFHISRGSKITADVVVVELAQAGARGRGECVPYHRYGESVDGVVAALEGLRPDVEAGLDADGLQARLPAGAARNALDCALWDLRAKLKLDKAGGFTEALRLRQAARDAGLRVMVGCMVSTSLSMAPALLVAQGAQFVDLDGPLLLAHDRAPGMAYRGSLAHPPPRALWG